MEGIRAVLEKALLVMLVTTARRTEGIPVGVIFTPAILGGKRERDEVNQASQANKMIRCWLTSKWREKGSIELWKQGGGQPNLLEDCVRYQVRPGRLMKLKQGKDDEERERKKEGKSRPKDSGRMVRLE